MKTTAVLAGILSVILTACTSGNDVALKSTEGVTPKNPAWKVQPGDPTYYINSVATSADGSRVVGGTFFHAYSETAHTAQTEPNPNDSSDGTFGTYCYNQIGQLLWKDEFKGWQGVYWVDISQNGAYAASGGWYSQKPYAGFVRAFNAATGSKLLDYPTAQRVNQVALSADGTWLVSAAETLVLFKLTNGTYQKSAEFTPTTSKDMIETVAMSADGQQIVCGDYAGSLYVFGNTAGKLTQQAQWKLPTGGYSHSIRITPDGKSFAAGGSAGNFYLFDIAKLISTGQPTLTYQFANKGSVYGVAIADDASALVGISNLPSGGSAGGLVYYVQRSGSQGVLKWQFQTLRNPNCASLNLANNQLAISDGHPDGTPGHFYLLNAATGVALWQYTTGNMSWPIMLSQNGKAIAAGSDDSNIYYFTP